MPLKLAGKVNGVLNLESNREAGFTSSDQQTADSLALTIAAVVRQAEEHEKLDELWRVFRGLSQLHRAILEKQDEALVLHELASRIVSLFKAFDLCVIRTLDTANHYLILRGVGHRAGVELDIADVGLRINLDDSIAGKAVRFEEPVVRLDVEHDEDFSQKELAKKLHLHGMLAVCIPALDPSSPPLGCISVYTTADDYRFQQEHVELLESIAGFVAVAVSNLRATLELMAVVETSKHCSSGAHERSALDGVLTASVSHDECAWRFSVP